MGKQKLLWAYLFGLELLALALWELACAKA
jgi:hypothetical protein